MGAAKLNLNGTEIAAELAKVTRADIYGETKTRVIGAGDEPLLKAGVAENGKDYITRGDIKYALVIGEEFTMKSPQIVSALDSKPVEQVPSSFAVAPDFKPATADEIARLEVATVYHLEGIQLPVGSKFLGSFNYRASYEKKDAAIVAKTEGVFLLVGTLKQARFIGMEVDSQLIAADEADADAEGDFGSLF
jgi:hypothetical protein